MSIAIRWKRGPLAGISLMIAGIAIFVEIPRLLHGQFILIIDKLPLLVAATIGMIGISIAGITLVMEGLMKRWKVTNKQVLKPLIFATGISSGITYISYFLGLQIFHALLAIYISWLEVYIWSYIFSLTLTAVVTIFLTQYISKILTE
jgi:hypothetical protein